MAEVTISILPPVQGMCVSNLKAVGDERDLEYVTMTCQSGSGSH